MHIVSLHMGSIPGYGRTFVVLGKSNLSPKEISDAYALGAQRIGVDLVKQVASTYDDNKLKSAHLKKFIDAGFEWKDASDEDYVLWTDTYPLFYLFTVKMGNPSFEWEELPLNSVDMGGYGIH